MELWSYGGNSLLNFSTTYLLNLLQPCFPYREMQNYSLKHSGRLFWRYSQQVHSLPCSKPNGLPSEVSSRRDSSFEMIHQCLAITTILLRVDQVEISEMQWSRLPSTLMCEQLLRKPAENAVRQCHDGIVLAASDTYFLHEVVS